MAKLNQIIAVEKDIASKTHRVITDAYHSFQKEGLLTGISRTYRPKDEEGDRLPHESIKVQVKGEQVVENVFNEFAKLFNITATKDYGNCEAKANIVINGVTIAEQVPATFLLFLEKKLVDIHTFVQKLPILDAGEDWHKDTAQDTWATSTIETTRTKKVPKNHVKAEATDKHPAQVEIYFEDIITGYWSTTKYSGKFSATYINQMLERVDKLRQAVKFAREEANSTQVIRQEIGNQIVAYLSERTYTH